MMDALPELIIFDCDGVLVDSEPISIQVLHELIVNLGVEITLQELKERCTGKRISSTIEFILSEYGVNVSDNDVIGMNRILFHRLGRELSVIPHVNEMLGTIPTKKCVASSSSIARIRYSLQIADILKNFEPHIFSADMVDRGKPEPDLFLLAAKTMGVDSRRCVVVEDSPAGICAAQRAGMRAFAFCGGSHIDERFKAAIAACTPDAIFEDMRILPQLLSTWRSQTADATLPQPSNVRSK